MSKRKILKSTLGRGPFMKFKVAYVTRDETFLVFTGNSIIMSDLSETAAETCADYLFATNEVVLTFQQLSLESVSHEKLQTVAASHDRVQCPSERTYRGLDTLSWQR